MPYDVQVSLVRTIPGLEEAEIMRPGYAIEYDFVYPTQLRHTLETKEIEGLFLAGQINGTSGYEEAAAQGLMAGINAALKLKGQPPLILGRQEAYIGVLIDDLVTKGTSEPYRMFTSRAEYRLLLRHDNAEFRLREKGFRVGLVREEEYERFLKKKAMFEREMRRLEQKRVSPSEVNHILREAGSSEITESITLEQLLKRPEITYSMIKSVCPPDEPLTEELENLVTTEVKYKGYIKKQMEMVERMKKLENRRIPEDFNYDLVAGLSREVLTKLKEVRPTSIAQASRIPGVTPAAISLLLVALERQRRRVSQQTGIS